MASRIYVCESEEHPSSLLAGLNKQRLKGQLCDVTVQVQGHQFKGHINVLATAMGYFRDLFGKSTIVKNDDLIEIPTIVNSTGFAKILDFIYTSQLCLSQSTVMQVLCSACYLQIPYVVEKCQEFISTHGHVTSTDLSEAVTQKLTSQHLHSLSANTGLSLLSRLNQFSDKSRARMSLLPSLPKNSSRPQKARESDERQECELINTPPSPENHSMGANGEGRVTPECADVRFLSKNPEKSNDTPHRRSNLDTTSNDGKQIALYLNQDRTPQQFNGDGGGNTFMHQPPGNQPFELVPREHPSMIDHKSLANYFSADQDGRSITAADMNNAANDNESLNQHPFKIEKIFDRNGVITSNMPNVLSMKTNPERMLDNVRLLPKIEKPKKEFGCDYCGKTFGRQQHLKRHILTHTGERPFPCEICSKRFRRSEHLKHHLMSHQQGMRTDGRKRPRKSPRAENAYSMPKIVLGGYNGHTDNDGCGIQADNGTFVSSPVILPSMFTDLEPRHTSPERNTTPGGELAPHSDNNQMQIDDRQGSPSYSQQSPMAALNLSSTNQREAEEPHFNQQRVSSPCEEASDKCTSTAPRIKAEIPAKVNINFPRSGSSSPTVNGYSGLLDETPSSSDIMGMEGSEVLTTDLKRLIAAMDE